ncbi:spindle pole body formation-associated protein-domain-containing protein [Apiospora arundinis]|uniref:Spindle pole body formation-associated protein-domain-containing protein n=1 Tax=Apiospora arundinis TaxID=335852 RepID=A0ABR2I054_9PEZI
MLGWAIKRGYQTATGASDAPRQPEDAGDTTQIDVPDTPAPVFAARAVRHAIFGTPAPATNTITRPPRLLSDNGPRSPPKSPPKPTGILMTPGTATSRRKRVSFGHEVQKKQNDAPAPSPTKPPISTKDDDMSDEEWEDEDPADVTIDLNEPKSQSGRYWKTQFNKYHDDAREEMSKLVKHKHLSRMYAQQKDVENTELQERVKELERQVQLKDEEIRQAQMRPSLTRSASVNASASSRERLDSEGRAAERARQTAEREVARLTREVTTLKKENEDLRKENEIIKANASDSGRVCRTTSAMTSERAAAAKARVAQKRRERAALRGT